MSAFYSAIEGSYERSFFVNPKTGGFCYPKYKTPPSAIVKIKDINNYREDFTTLDDLDDLNDPMLMFEFELKGGFLEFELTSFDDVFDSIVRRAELFPKLKGLGSELISLADDPDSFGDDDDPDLPKGFRLFNEGDQKLFDASMLQIFPVEHGSELEKIVRKATLEGCTIEKLKKICDDNKVPRNGKKDELVGRILAANAVFKLNPLVQVNSRKLYSLLDLMTDVYINDIKSSIDKWHPLFMEHVWSSAKDCAECEIVEQKIEAIMANPYWASRLKLITD